MLGRINEWAEQNFFTSVVLAAVTGAAAVAVIFPETLERCLNPPQRCTGIWPYQTCTTQLTNCTDPKQHLIKFAMLASAVFLDYLIRRR